MATQKPVAQLSAPVVEAAQKVGKLGNGTEFLKLKPGYRVFLNENAETKEKTISISRYNGKDAEGNDCYVGARLGKQELMAVNQFAAKWL